MDGEPGETPTLFPEKVGEKLRDARLAQGLELSDIAARTRIPLRHLEAIETSDYSGLPSPTYAVGFVKSYARAIGADEVALAKELRAETSSMFAAREAYETYDPEDPVREPSSGLVWAGAVIAVLLLAALALWYGTDLFRSSGTPEPEPLPTETPLAVPAAAPSPAAPANGGQVTLTATEPVWLRIYDASGTRLFEKEMAAGERYDVPQNANGPMINLGRPEAIRVTVNGSDVAPLGTPGRAIKDVPISAAALQARGSGATPAATPTPAASTTPANRSSRPLPPAFRPAFDPPAQSQTVDPLTPASGNSTAP
ncbi:helix-turn-helix domain-containing protein [Sphingomonas koreensis]|uniref:Helix-turn-helix domain-containing protein n=1 Tax=Sphingomonas koreensis TaxID=93064 RepID=A0A430G5X7_9SPHN|nr:helix-turn-helix domain-containing protein [Sphingomonas koreensis]RSY87957.1 helix-turn-helix domain-containing protein [Sphingomonas koreensis]